MKKNNVIILFSGGKDSFLCALKMLEEGYNVNLITYENGCGLHLKNVKYNINKLIKKYGNDRVKFLGFKNVSAIFREFLFLYYNLLPSKIIEKYGEVSISQFNCLSCRLAMYVVTIIEARNNNINLIIDGARKSQLFAIEQDLLVENFKKLFQKYNLKINYPLLNEDNDFIIKNEILIRGFVPKTLEPQCLIGMPIEKLDNEIVKSVNNVYENLLKDKAIELIKKYENTIIEGDFI